MVLPPFQHLVDEHWRDVARLSAALAGPDDAEDCAQRAWLAALRAYPDLRHARNLKGWLMTITARCATDGHRDRVRRPAPSGELPERAAAAAPGPEPPDEVLWAQVRALPERQRQAVALRYALDLPHVEVAAALGTTETASRRLVSDALKRLRTEVDDG